MTYLSSSADAEALTGREAVFPASEFTTRINALRRALEPTGAEALLVLGPENIFWATGHQTAGYFAFQALLVPLEAPPVLLVRQLELTGARVATWLGDIRAWQDGEDPASALAAMIRDHRFRHIAIERDAWFISQALAAHIETTLFDIGLSDGSGIVESLRAVKSPAELTAIRCAATYALAGLCAGIEACREGVTENDIAAAMMSAAISAGSEAMAMEPLVSSGPRSGVPHTTWRRRRLGAGDGVFLEMAANHDRYHSALMRSVWIGPPPDTVQSMMDTACRALDAALDAMEPGRPCSAPHMAAQAVIDEAGHTAAFRKRIGYSMGTAFAPEWGEGKVLSLFTGVDRPMEPGMVFHLPTTLRSYGDYTVGASETVIVTDSGIEVLSDLPRQITIR